MIEKDKVFFQTPEGFREPDADGIIYRAIDLDLINRQHFLISWRCVSKVYDGKTEETIISFDDPSVLEETVTSLNKTSLAKIQARGKVVFITKHVDETEEFNDSILKEEKTGIITCELIAINGVIRPFFYQIEEAREIIPRKQDAELKILPEVQKREK